MAKLEFYRQQVAPNLVTPSGAGIAEAGRSRAQAIQAVQSLTDTAAQMFERLDTVKAEDAFNKLRETQTKLMMDPNEGFLSKKSADAVSADFMRKYVEDFDKSIEETASGLQNERQRELFKRRAAAANAQYQSTLRNHVLNETDAYNKQTFEGVVKTESAAAATTYNDPASVALSLDRIRNNAVNYANSAGIKGDAQVALVNASLAEAHNSILAAAIGNNNFGFVKEYMKQFDKGGRYEGQLGAERTAQLKNSIETADTRDASLKLSLELADKKLSFSSQRKQVDDMYRAGKITSQVRDQTVQRIDNNEARVKANETEFNNSMSGQAQEWILNNPGKPIVDMPPNLYNWARNKGVLATLNTFSTSVERNVLPEGANELYTNLVIAAADAPEQFVKTFDQNIGTFRMQLSPTQFASIEAKRASLGAAAFKDAKKANTLDVAAKTVRGIKADITAAGIDVTPKEGSAQAMTLANFNAALIEQIELNSERLERPVTMVEARKIALDLLKEGKLLDAGPFKTDKSIRTFEVTPEMREKYDFIPVLFDEIDLNERTRLSGLILSSPALIKKLGVKIYGDGKVSNPSLQRAVELAYAAELEGYALQ